MSKPTKDARPTPRLPRGLRDIEAAELRQQQDMLAKIRAVYELYGFEPLETPAFEYTDALGKFLPDQDRPNAGVFSFQDAPEARDKADAGEWMSLRYDLTAPLARYVAQNYQDMPKPFRRYAVGPVWRNEKPGPGRFRQFMQFDADTVGAESVAADAEMCMLAADTLEALGIKRGDYVIKVNNRKVLDGVLRSCRTRRRRKRRRRLIGSARDRQVRPARHRRSASHCSGRAARTKAATSRKGAELTRSEHELVVDGSQSFRPTLDVEKPNGRLRSMETRLHYASGPIS